MLCLCVLDSPPTFYFFSEGRQLVYTILLTRGFFGIPYKRLRKKDGPKSMFKMRTNVEVEGRRKAAEVREVQKPVLGQAKWDTQG